jgi:hypothetical protein
MAGGATGGNGRSANYLHVDDAGPYVPYEGGGGGGVCGPWSTIGPSSPGQHLPSGAKDVLDRAREIASGDRQRDYGHPIVNHTRTAKLWSAFLGIEITPEQVCDLNALQKFSRLAHSPDHEDSELDVVGWIVNREACRKARAHREHAKLPAL